jgi:lipopolysaccharide transport system ATP-binding protein
MSDIAINVEDVSKLYRLGQIGTGTFKNDLKKFWSKVRGNGDPFEKIGEENDRTKKTDSEWVWALKNINFEVKKGEVMGIIGRNGAGKSTLLKILSQITAPTTGRITIHGNISSLLEVGTGFHPELTGRDNIFLNGAILGMRKNDIQRKFEEIVEFSGVEKYLDTPVKRYSSGMYVRLAFAVAANLDPEILILDEVLAVGDAEFQKKCINKIRNISERQGKTIIYVSHNIDVMKTLCNSALLLKNGLLNYSGSFTDTISRYISEGRIPNELSLKNPLIYETGISDINFYANDNIIFDLKNYENCDVRFSFIVKNISEKHIIGFTIFNSDNESIISSVSSDGISKITLGENVISANIPCGLFLPGKYYLEFSYNGKSVENAIEIEKTETKSNYISSGNVSRANLVSTNWKRINNL